MNAKQIEALKRHSRQLKDAHHRLDAATRIPDIVRAMNAIRYHEQKIAYIVHQS